MAFLLFAVVSLHSVLATLCSSSCGSQSHAFTNVIQIESEEALTSVQGGLERQPISLSLELEASSHLFLSLSGKPRAVVTEEVQRLSLAELSTIWTVSTCTAAH